MGATLNRMVTEGLPERVTFDQQQEADERWGYVDVKKENRLGNKSSLCKGREAENCLSSQRNSKDISVAGNMSHGEKSRGQIGAFRGGQTCEALQPT